MYENKIMIMSKPTEMVFDENTCTLNEKLILNPHVGIKHSPPTFNDRSVLSGTA